MKAYFYNVACDFRDITTSWLRHLPQTEKAGEADVIFFNYCVSHGMMAHEACKKLLDIISSRKSDDVPIFLGECISAYLKKSSPNIEEQVPNIIYWDYEAGWENKLSTYNLQAKRSYTSTEEDMIYIVIADGCNNKCDFCMVNYASFRIFTTMTIPSIIEAIESSKSKHVVLKGLNTAMYGVDNGGPQLHTLISVLGQNTAVERIYIDNLAPQNMYKELFDELKTNIEKVGWIKTSIQTGSKRLEKIMNRKGGIDNVRKLRTMFPELEISTELIANYPKENDIDIEETISFVKENNLIVNQVYTFMQGDTPAGRRPHYYNQEHLDKLTQLL